MNNMPVSRNAPVYKRQLHLPDPATVGDTEIAKAIAETQALRDKAERAKADAVEAGFAVERAEADDRQREADHVRGRLKSKPKPTMPAARTKAEEAEHAAAVAAIAATDAEAELLELLAERGPALAVAEREKAAREVEAAHKAALKVAEHLGKRRGHLGLASYLADPTKPKHQAGELRPGQLRKPNGNPVQVAEALDLVIEATDPNRPPAPTRDQRTWSGQTRQAQPLRPVAR
jgi:hypothetical protein